VASSADVMHTSAQMTLKIHHHQIGDGYALAVSVIWWEIWLFTFAPHFGDHPRYEEHAHGRLQKWPLSCLICTPYQKITPEIQF